MYVVIVVVLFGGDYVRCIEYLCYCVYLLCVFVVWFD